MTQTHEEMTSSVRLETWWMYLAQSLNRNEMLTVNALWMRCTSDSVYCWRCIIWCIYCLHLSGHQSDLTELLSVFTGCVQTEPSEQVWHSSSRRVHARRTVLVLNQKSVVCLDQGSPDSVLQSLAGRLKCTKKELDELLQVCLIGLEIPDLTFPIQPPTPWLTVALLEKLTN